MFSNSFLNLLFLSRSSAKVCDSSFSSALKFSSFYSAERRAASAVDSSFVLALTSFSKETMYFFISALSLLNCSTFRWLSKRAEFIFSVKFVSLFRIRSNSMLFVITTPCYSWQSISSKNLKYLRTDSICLLKFDNSNCKSYKLFFCVFLPSEIILVEFLSFLLSTWANYFT